MTDPLPRGVTPVGFDGPVPPWSGTLPEGVDIVLSDVQTYADHSIPAGIPLTGPDCPGCGTPADRWQPILQPLRREESPAGHSRERSGHIIAGWILLPCSHAVWARWWTFHVDLLPPDAAPEDTRAQCVFRPRED